VITGVQLLAYPTLAPISAIPAGGQAVAAVYGVNFGPAQGSVAVCHDGANPCVSSDVIAAITYWSAGQVNLLLTAASTSTGVYDIVLTSLGLLGTGFLQAPQGGGAQSNPGRIAAAAPPTISITSSGFAITTAQCNGSSGTSALISPGGAFTSPIMPPLTYTLQNGPAGNVTWQLNVNDGRADSVGPDVRTYPGAISAGPSSTQDWGTLGNIGGNATITATYTGGSVSASFCILGTNPAVSNVLSYLQAQPAGYFWAVPFLVSQESSTEQFNYNNNSITPYGFPLSDGPSGWGYGVMQLSNGTGTTDQLWNWQSNVVAGMTLLASLESLGDGFWAAQISASASSPIQIGNDSESLCEFTPISGRTSSGSPHSYADAIILKRYNSAAMNHDYVGSLLSKTGQGCAEVW